MKQIMRYYYEDKERVLQSLDSCGQGLSDAEAAARLERNGRNKLKEAKKESLLSRFFNQLKDPMIIILIAAAIVSGVVSVVEKESFSDTIIIIAVVLLNAVLGVYQESKAEKAIEALQAMSSATSRVLRGGMVRLVKSEELVVGDVVLLEAGDAVPADARVIECASLQAEEAPPIRAYHAIQQRETDDADTPVMSAPKDTPAVSIVPGEVQAATHVSGGKPVSLTRMLPWIWLTGVGCMLLYMALSCLRMWAKVRKAPHLYSNVYRCGDFGTPFVLGLFSPRIYLPDGLPEDDLPQVLAHEHCHVRRGDHIVKPLAFLLLSLHWFNPALWLAYVLLGRLHPRPCLLRRPSPHGGGVSSGLRRDRRQGACEERAALQKARPVGRRTAGRRCRRHRRLPADHAPVQD